MLQPTLRNLLLLLGSSAVVSAQGAPEVVDRILKEGKENSHVWETLMYLSEEIGPRLTGSSRLAQANEWTRAEFERMGLTNAHLAQWGEIPVRFDRGPCSASMVAPTERPFEFTARAWSAGTDGPVRGPVFLMPDTQEAFDAIAGELEGAWILRKSRSRRRPRDSDDDEVKQARALAEHLEEAVNGASIAGTISSSRNDLVVTGGQRGWRELTMETLPTRVEISVRRSDYDAMQELLAAGEPVEVEVDLDHTFSAGPVPVHNTVAEIRGSEWPEQVVILSAHLDSWDGPGSMGTQDNGTGSSVMLEAARILMAAEAKPRRTIRFCLWTGEEQGLLGSRGYVDALPEDERELISAAFVDDGGTNYQGGLVCVESMLGMLDTAMAPAVTAFPDYDVLNVVNERMPKGGASDHASFNRIGVPGFFWIEKGKGGREERNYGFIHHTQHDTPRYAVQEYLVQSATTSAVIAYNLAMADDLLPREPADAGAVAIVDAGFEPVSGPLSGGWTGTMVFGEVSDPLPFSINLTHGKGATLRGNSDSPLGQAILHSGKFDDVTGKGSFMARTDSGDMKCKIHLAGGKLMGEVFMGEQAFATFEATRPVMEQSPLNGTWDGEVLDRGSHFTLTLSLFPDGAVQGWYKSSQADTPIVDGKWNADEGTLFFRYDYPHAGMLDVEAKLEKGKLVGAINGSMAFEATLKK